MRYLMLSLALSLMMIMSLPVPAQAGYQEDFAREFLSKTWAGERIEENACIDCHSSEQMKPAFREITDEWKKSWHAQNNVSCQDCHGGDPKDPSVSMTHQRGFVGAPSARQVPEFCGKCHIGILKNYLESGHGKALRSSGKGPNCTVCHGSHNIQRANIDIINEQRCTKCHSYERAKVMKQALFLVEKKAGEIEDGIRELRRAGIYPQEQERALFNTKAEFRTLFHSVDVTLVNERTGEFIRKLDDIEKGIQNTFVALRSRKNFSAFLTALFGCMGFMIFLLTRTPKE
jgi:nitrate/TMAO reductase-like tetraheme cytochrome c subunit